MEKKLRAIAIYLPQFHPFKENNEWWGNGFTEWTNVVKGKKIVKGQYQPHLPSDLGFYDLRLEEVREAQVELAKTNGISGFCYYHYWFNGKRMLQKPIDEVLRLKKPDFPFCFCWANESWSRNWDGRNKDILLHQNYNDDDDREHIKFLCENVFNDERYIKVDGKPLFIIYRPSLFPDIKRTVHIWREEAKKYGFENLYLGSFWSFDAGVNPSSYGLDFAAMFPPNEIPLRREDNYIGYVLKKLGIKLTVKQKYNVYKYKKLVDYCCNMIFPTSYLLYPGITPMWDNYVRRRNGGGRIFINSTPTLYKKWLENISNKFNPPSAEENFIFINAWNEWAEGNHLEPCEKWGHQYLEATKAVMKKYM